MNLWKKIKAAARSRLGLPAGLESDTLLGVPLQVRAGTVRRQADYDDAWFLACARQARVIFDIGANVGYDALIALCAGKVEQIILIEANPSALSIAAENLIFNGMSAPARFVSSFAADSADEELDFWTIGTGAAGSMYASHAQSAAHSGETFRVSTTTVDGLCDRYGCTPNFIKVDVEGAERKVLRGSAKTAGRRETRFLVEMHSGPELSMEANARAVLDWCTDLDYYAWYLKEHARLESPAPIRSRGRCHLLLQPSEWEYPDWLLGIEQSAPLSYPERK